MRRVLAAAVITVALQASVMAQTAAGSSGCTVITRAAADGIAGRIQADDSAIRPPSERSSCGVRIMT